MIARLPVIVLIAVLYMICIIISVCFDGTFDTGDGVVHYFFSRYAFNHPENFLDHWAKPVFVLLSAPFAQFGFSGIKIFNSTVAALTAWLVYRVAIQLRKENAALAPVMLFCTPLYFLSIFSGLTETLFGLFLISAIWLALRERWLMSSLVVSLMPFVRSEGLIILGVFAAFFSLKKKFKAVPVLMAGHLIFSFAGYFHYNDFLWVFNKIPYASLDSPYGSGRLLHFVNQLFYVVGVPVYIFLCMGLLQPLLASLSKKRFETSAFATGEYVLMYGCFISFFVAHSLFWWLGIFNSMGLKRVFIGVIPLIAIIALNGYNLINQVARNYLGRFSKVISFFLIVYVLLFPFTSNKAAIRWSSILSFSPSHRLVREMSLFLKEKYPGYTLYHGNPCINFEMNINPFNSNEYHILADINSSFLPEHSVLIWDDWFAVEQGLPLDAITNDARFQLVKSFETMEGNREVRMVVFVKK